MPNMWGKGVHSHWIRHCSQGVQKGRCAGMCCSWPHTTSCEWQSNWGRRTYANNCERSMLSSERSVVSWKTKQNSEKCWKRRPKNWSFRGCSATNTSRKSTGKSGLSKESGWLLKLNEMNYNSQFPLKLFCFYITVRHIWIMSIWILKSEVLRYKRTFSNMCMGLVFSMCLAMYVFIVFL